MRKQLLTGARNPVRHLCAAALFAGAMLAVSCSGDDPNAERGDFIRVYIDPDGEPLDGIYFDVEGEEAAKVYVRSNVDYEVFWQDGASSPWGEVLGLDKNVEPGLDRIRIKIDRRENYCYYTRREGMLMLSSPGRDFGKFVRVYQGAVARVSQAFAWLTYGSTDPLVSDGERAYSGWTDAQKNYGWTTSAPSSVFGRNGYVKLGDAQGNGADLITPFVNDLRGDSLLMVSFRAVAYTDETGSDGGKLTVNILDGGVFIDTGLTTRRITLGTYTVENEAVSGSMWDDSNYLLFVAKTDANPISGNTRIQFVAEDVSGPANNRIFMDNIYVYTLNELNDGMIEQNRGTDKDIILGAMENED